MAGRVRQAGAELGAGGLAASVRRFLHFNRGFWRGETRLLALGLSVAVLALSVAAFLFQLRMNIWNRDFFDALEKRDADMILTQVSVFFGIWAFGICVAVLFVATRMALQVRWRQWLTKQLMKRWAKNARAYRLETMRADLANPEYRMTADVQKLTELFVDFVIGFIGALLAAAGFISILIVQGGALEIAIGGAMLVIPAYMVLAAILYSTLATLLMVVVGKPLVGITETKNQAEADFVVSLTRFRENAGGIALAQGEDQARALLLANLRGVVTSWFAIMRRQMGIATVTNSHAVLIAIVPVLLLSPKYVRAEITLGQMIQLAAAFSMVVGAFNWFVDNFPRLAEWSASVNRVIALAEGIEAARRQEAYDAGGHIALQRGDGPDIVLDRVTLRLPNGTLLVEDASVVIEKGSREILEGHSGGGKSTLVRAIAGVWPWGSGRIVLPRRARMMVVPQRPYLPTGTLKDVLAFPEAATQFSDESCLSALREVGLASRSAQLAINERWDQLLAPAEQQRIAVARVLLHKPDILIMDEATCDIDQAGEQDIYRAIIAALPESTILSVSHRASTAAFHDWRLVLERGIEGERDTGSRLGAEERIAHV